MFVPSNDVSATVQHNSASEMAAFVSTEQLADISLCHQPDKASYSQIQTGLQIPTRSDPRFFLQAIARYSATDPRAVLSLATEAGARALDAHILPGVQVRPNL